ncbi:MAG: hypothetical protein ACYDD1_14105 [Caulobacteraceae bacterium]
MTRSEIVQGVGKRLFTAEQKLDAAFIELAALAAELPTARTEAGLSMKAGAAAVTEFSQALAQLAAAREAISRGHDKLAVVQRAMGDATKLTGGGEKTESALVHEHV